MIQERREQDEVAEARDLIAAELEIAPERLPDLKTALWWAEEQCRKFGAQPQVVALTPQEFKTGGETISVEPGGKGRITRLHTLDFEPLWGVLICWEQKPGTETHIGLSYYREDLQRQSGVAVVLPDGWKYKDDKVWQIQPLEGRWEEWQWSGTEDFGDWVDQELTLGGALRNIFGGRR